MIWYKHTIVDLCKGLSNSIDFSLKHLWKLTKVTKVVEEVFETLIEAHL